MNTMDIAQARSFVLQAQLPAPFPETLGAQAPGDISPFDAAKQQAAVVGSDVVSFVKDTTPEHRQDIANASLLAQLVANRQLPAPKDLQGILDWYTAYFNVMSQIGFAVQSKGFAQYAEKADTFEAHEAIIEIVETALAGAPAAIPLVIKTLESLKKLSQDSPWITLFHRESRSANTARFQVSTASEDASLNVLAFGIIAKASITQVLLFKFTYNESTLQHNSSELTINPVVLAGIRDDITQKITKYSKDFIAGLEI
jgi:hypothetical protein